MSFCFGFAGNRLQTLNSLYRHWKKINAVFPFQQIWCFFIRSYTCKTLVNGCCLAATWLNVCSFAFAGRHDVISLTEVLPNNRRAVSFSHEFFFAHIFLACLCRFSRHDAHLMLTDSGGSPRSPHGLKADVRKPCARTARILWPRGLRYNYNAEVRSTTEARMTADIPRRVRSVYFLPESLSTWKHSIYRVFCDMYIAHVDIAMTINLRYIVQP